MNFKMMHLGGKTLERVTDVVATAGIASWFTPEIRLALEAVSEWAALLMPILGSAWLLVQIVFKFTRKEN